MCNKCLKDDIAEIAKMFYDILASTGLNIEFNEISFCDCNEIGVLRVEFSQQIEDKIAFHTAIFEIDKNRRVDLTVELYNNLSSNTCAAVVDNLKEAVSIMRQEEIEYSKK